MSRPQRHRVAAVIAGGLTAAALVLPVPVASAQTAPVTSPMAAESWYRTTPLDVPSDGNPLCDLPVAAACTPVPEVGVPSQYAADTLHVGVTGGSEESRSFVSLNLSVLPVGAEIAGGTLFLPVATDPQSGTVLPETATLRACLVTAAVKDAVDGAITGAPDADCDTTSPATFRAAEGAQPPVFSIDLAPFAQTWRFGAASLALVPAEEQAEGATWHVAFSRRERQADGAVPITAKLELRDAGAGFDLGPLDDGPSPASVGVPGSSGFDSGSLPASDPGTSFAAPPIPDAASSPAASTAGPPQGTVPVASVLSGPFSYPAVFLLPLLAAVAVGWAGRAFTRDLIPVEA